MAKVFDRDKYEAYQSRLEAAAAAYHTASEDFRFERNELSKMLSFFSRDFRPGNKHYAEIYAAIDRVSKTHLNGLPAIESELKRIIALAEDDSQHQNRLRLLADQIVTTKRAETKRDAAAQHSNDLRQCWGVLEEFARPYLRQGYGVGSVPAPAQNPTSAGSYYAE